MTREQDDEENIVSTTFTSGVTAYGAQASRSPAAVAWTACCKPCSVGALSAPAADRTTTIHHWQLRDLISAANNEHEFYCVDEQQVFLYNVKAKEVCKLC